MNRRLVGIQEQRDRSLVDDAKHYMQHCQQMKMKTRMEISRQNAQSVGNMKGKRKDGKSCSNDGHFRKRKNKEGVR